MKVNFEGKPLEDLDDEALLRARAKVIAHSNGLASTLCMGAGILAELDAEIEQRGICVSPATVN